MIIQVNADIRQQLLTVPSAKQKPKRKCAKWKYQYDEACDKLTDEWLAGKLDGEIRFELTDGYLLLTIPVA